MSRSTRMDECSPARAALGGEGIGRVHRERMPRHERPVGAGILA